jgi:2-amino-4-hydroxy-6-hydroxymethyldihydropteridine diphosphokinase
VSRRAFLGLGSNLGERLTYLRGAVDAMPDLACVSSLYETDPIGGPEQGAYLNCVVELDTDLTPRQLLVLCRTLEAAAERIRIERWGPRTLDVDVVYVDGEVVNEPDLVVPHPRWRDRAFVMIPLGELAPDLLDGWVDPDEGDVRNVGPL